MLIFPIFTHVSQFQGKIICDAAASNERICVNNIKLVLYVQKYVMNLNKGECDKYLQQPRV